MGKFEVYEGNNQTFYFRLKAGNGQVILASQGYQTKASAKAGIRSVKTNAIKDAQFDRKESKNGKHFFNLVARNKEIIGSSEMYESKTSMENGIKSVGKNAPDAEVFDVEK
ncbi:MAG: hypothetical protein CR972_02060 [Candidatus Moraniibacteriota bacterium]|nr:MAG: hypothetical protein CR972_02060 [Candidatus Moranbacteria bacterium]